MRISIGNIVATAITCCSVVLGAQIIHAGQQPRVLYVEVPAAATAPADRLPITLAGYGDSSMEWGLAAGFVTLESMRSDFRWDSNDQRADRNSYAELGCPLVLEDGMLQQHAAGVDRGEAWIGAGDGGALSCDWLRSPTADVVLASWGPTAAYDRLRADGTTTSIEDATFRVEMQQRMLQFEQFVGVPVLWLTWQDEPSPTNREDLFAQLLDTRACSFDLSTLHLSPSDYDDGIHLSPQGSLTVAAALIEPAKECLA